MEFKLKPLEVSPEAPFEHDGLDRQPSVEALTNLIKSLPAPSVIAVDSPWGTGKTTFIRFLQANLEKSGARTLYFNAWESDFAVDPLVAFLGELNSKLRENTPNHADFHQQLDIAKKAASAISKRLLPVAGKIATAGLLDLDDFIEGALSDLVSTSINDAIDAYSAEKALIETFRESLTAAIGDQEPDKRLGSLVIFVDELDRCRPTYAVQLLERVKHLFNIPNVVFVLALDKQQLGVSLASVYGAGIDSDEYLRRFIDLEFLLPTADPEKFTRCLYDRFGFEEFFSKRIKGDSRYDKSNLIDTFVELSKVFDLSLRAREQCFSRIRVALGVTPDNQLLFPNFVVGLSVLKIVHPALYKSYALGDGTASDVTRFVREQDGGNAFLDDHYGVVFESFLIAGKCNHLNLAPEMLDYQAITKDESKAPEVRERATHLVKMTQDILRPVRSPLRFVVNKIELAALFR